MKAVARRSILRLIGFMVVIVVVGVMVARTYYGNLNRAVDPRIQQARELYERYDETALTGNYFRIFALLDSISAIYSHTPHYAKSFELGVLHNNRAAALLTIALYRDSIPVTANPYYDLSTDSIVEMAEHNLRASIAIYEGWDAQFEGKDEEEIRRMIEPEFMDALGQVNPKLADKYLKNRAKEIKNALVENQRRLSVCHTNLGVIYRYRKQYPEAVAQYEKAMELWDRNLDAENNLNKLLGRPLKKRNIIQRIFPPDKEITPKN
jgi:tetratricopeptide (TPR) repeat protein